jgi:RNA polymerase sigma-70 factor, ECF subfamily
MNDKQKQFNNLFMDSKKKLYNVAFGVVMNKEKAEDVLQDAYVKAWRKFDDYDNDKKFINWMAKIVKNAAIDCKRSMSKHSIVSSLSASASQTNNGKNQERFLDVVDKKLDLFELYEKKELANFIIKSVGKLPKDLQIVIMPFLDGYSHDEISKITGLSITTVRSRVHSAKKIIRNLYSHESKINF